MPLIGKTLSGIELQLLSRGKPRKLDFSPVLDVLNLARRVFSRLINLKFISSIRLYRLHRNDWRQNFVENKMIIGLNLLSRYTPKNFTRNKFTCEDWKYFHLMTKKKPLICLHKWTHFIRLTGKGGKMKNIPPNIFSTFINGQKVTY